MDRGSWERGVYRCIKDWGALCGEELSGFVILGEGGLGKGGHGEYLLGLLGTWMY